MQNMRNELRGCLAYTCSIQRAPTIILVSCLMVLLSYSLALAYTDSETQLDQSLKIVQSEDRSTIAWWIPASLWEDSYIRSSRFVTRSVLLITCTARL